MTTAHNSESINTIAKAYSETLEILQYVEEKDSYDQHLLVEPLTPLFKVR